MRCHALILATLAFAAAPSLAQTRADAPPPVPDARPPALEIIDDSVQPQVTIRKQGNEIIEEHRVNGKLYKVTVKPESAPPYTLVDLKGDGNMTRIEAPGTPQISVPMWDIGTF